MAGSYFVYILRCENDYLYIGIAKDVEARFALHQKGRGAKFTRINKPRAIVYSRKIGSLSKALKKEAAFKKNVPRGKGRINCQHKISFA